jgi:hypothetical protein
MLEADAASCDSSDTSGGTAARAMPAVGQIPMIETKTVVVLAKLIG